MTLIADLNFQGHPIILGDLIISLLGADRPHDEDEGIAEALGRDAGIEANPKQAIILAQLDSPFQRRRS